MTMTYIVRRVCVCAARYRSWSLLPVHSEHLRCDPVHSTGLGRRHGRVVRGFHHRLHVLLLRTYESIDTLPVGGALYEAPFAQL